MKNIWKTLTRQKAVFAILALLVIMGGAELFTHTTFYTLYNWLDMLRSAAVLEIVAMGVSVAVLCGGCDLSVGGTLCIGGILAVMTVNAGLRNCAETASLRENLRSIHSAENWI